MRSWLREVQEAPDAATMPRPGAAVARPAAGGRIRIRPSAEGLLPDGAHRAGYETILDWPAFENWLAEDRAAPLTALDTETTSLDPLAARIVGISLAVAEGEAAYLPLAHDYPGVPAQLPCDEVLARLQPWLESPGHAKIGQNLKYDQHVLANHGIALAGVAHDTLLQSYVLESGKDGVRGHDLGQPGDAPPRAGDDPLRSAVRQGRQPDRLRAGGDRARPPNTPPRTPTSACACTPALSADRRRRRLARVYADDRNPGARHPFPHGAHGVLIDAQLLTQQSHEIGKRLLDLEARAHAAAGQPFNVNSPKQLAEILFDKLGLPVKKKTPSGTPSTDEEVLSELALDYPLPKILLESRQLAKLKGTYTDKLPKMVNAGPGACTPATRRRWRSPAGWRRATPTCRTSRCAPPKAGASAPPSSRRRAVRSSRPTIRRSSCASWRTCRKTRACSKPSRRARTCIARPPPRFSASLPVDVGPDQRRVAKVINFGLIYGMSAFGLARAARSRTRRRAAYIERYFARYPGVAATWRRRASGQDAGLRRNRFRPPAVAAGNPFEPGRRRQGAERAAINAPMQGSAADLIKSAMIAVQGWLDAERLQTRLLMQVHDELVLEVPDDELARVRGELPRLMTEWRALRVPLLVDVGVGANWDEAH
jgi:DNA polymerase-1